MKIWILNIACLLLCLQPMASAQTYRYEPAVVTLQGRLLSAPGETPDGAKLNFPALRLDKPITVQGDNTSPTERGVTLMHVVLDSSTRDAFKRLLGQPVSMTGTLFHADNGRHQTPVLVIPSSITPLSR